MTHKNISLLLCRLLVSKSASDPKSIDQKNFSRSDTRLVDSSGNYLLQVTLRVQDGSKIENVNKGANELFALKETLRGVVELEMADRLSLDTRVR